MPERIREGLDASDRYLVWSEATYNNGIATNSSDIFGWDLRSNTAVDVSLNESYDQTAPSISGSVVVYQSQVYSNSFGLDYVRGKDLATGATYQVSNGPRPVRSPKISGRSVVWMEFDENGDHLLTKDLGQASATTIAETPDANTSHITIVDPAISDEYILWTEYAYWDPRYGDPPRYSLIKAYNRKTGQITNIADYLGTSSGGNEIEYSLDGHRVVLSGDEPRVIDLNTGQSTDLDLSRSAGWDTMYSPDLKGNYIVWSGSRNAASWIGSGEGWDIWGVDLSTGGKLVPVPLVIGSGDRVSPRIAGDNLVWLNGTDPREQHIGILSLSAAFANAPAHQKELDRMVPPVPTPVP